MEASPSETRQNPKEAVVKSFLALRRIHEASEAELEPVYYERIKPQIGNIDKTYNDKIRDKFYSLLTGVKDVLPEAIPLEETGEYQSVIESPKGRVVSYTYMPAYSRYYVPSIDKIYRLLLLPGKLTDNKYIPGNKDFIGIKAIKEEKNPDGQTHGLPFGVYLDDLDNHGNHGPLEANEINTLLGNLEGSIGKEPNKEILDKTRQEIIQLEEQWANERSSRGNFFGEQLKGALIELKNTLLKEHKLPKFVDVGVSGMRGDNRGVFFLPQEEKLVFAPRIVSKTFLKGTREKPDFIKAEDAPIKLWAEYSMRIARELLSATPFRDILRY